MDYSAARAISIHYGGEVSLKGGNRSEFERKLADNIRSALSGIPYRSLERSESRLILALESAASEGAALDAISKVFGIEWYAPALVVPNDMGSMRDAASEAARGLGGRSMRVDTRRSDKSYPMKSPDISREIGRHLESGGFSMELDNPQETLLVELLRGRAIISTRRIQGLGGLPVGSSGKVLCLLSGGIDSPVASWLMMKRGCDVDFLHVHPFASAADAKGSKIAGLASAIRKYSPRPLRLLLAPYTEFYKRAFDVEPRIEMVLFRRFMFRLASRVAEEHGYMGIVTGDSVGQVASQTLENIYAANEAARLPVYRPLVAYDKKEIIELAKRVGTFGMSIQEYKDCCSLVAHKHPSTRVRLSAAKEAEKAMDPDAVISETIAKMDSLEV